MVPVNGNRTPKIPVEGMKLPPLLNSEQARKALGDMPESTFRRLTMTGALPSRKLGARVFVRLEDLKAFIDGLPATASAA